MHPLIHTLFINYCTNFLFLGGDIDTAVCDEFDEFGFKVDIEDGPEQSSSKLLSTPFQDNPQQRLKWLAHLEFAQTSSSPLPKVRVNSNIM